MRRLFLLSFVALACSLEPPFDRTNPFDPGSPYPMRLEGVPDTVASIGERFQAVIERDPPINTAGLAIQWVVTDPNNILAGVPEIQHLFNGDYVSTNVMSARLKTVAIGARFNDDVVVGRYITVGQLVDTLNLYCSNPCATMPISVGWTFPVFSDARDARGNEVRFENFAMQRAVVTIRNPAVIGSAVTPNGTGMYVFSALSAGSSWIVIRSDRATDSVHVTVTP
jgi:hypothetical protein